MDELPFGGPEIANPLERIDVVVSRAIHFPLPGSPAEFMHLMKPKTGAAMHRVTATATVLLALALGGATTAEPLRTLALTSSTHSRRCGGDGSMNQLKEKWGVW